ncbi:MAG TPA: BamA/TamA family outer membrane protein [Candidatus Eisenbacteria bacterium]|nr:BamA/TamA family outer membrane protein [Candidatus Eisenbacteria bacterium]
MIRRAPLYAAPLLALALLSGTAHAQYFGQNKVRYRRFDFKVLKTEHFDIYYYPEEAAAVDDAARMAERWYTRLSKALDHELSKRQPLVLYASHPDFEQTNIIGGELGEGTGGVTEALKRRIVLPLAGPPAETDHVIGHELVHAFQYDILGGGRPGFALGQGPQLPLWFMEGMAEYLSLGPGDPHTAMWMRDAASNNKLPDWRHLDDPRYFPYRFGQAFWAYLAGRYGEECVARILKAGARSNGDAAKAMQAGLSIAPDSLVRGWHQAVRDWNAPVAAATEPASKEGHVLEAAQHKVIGTLNLAPALSPDGNDLLFFSERSLFSIELYLADAHTGKVRRAITKTALDSHFQGLEFINSSGAWSPDGRSFALGAVSRGRPVLTVLDVNTGRRLHEATFRNMGEILNPSWAPDGHRVCFSAIAGGLTDLYVWDFQSRELRQLTHDAAADIEPAWSPDGAHIAFVTDRFGHPGEYRLAIMDVATGDIRPGPGFDDGKNIDPQWSPDGATLYFVSDHTGISNLYRVPVAGGTPVQLTNLLTGVSGITRLSPAFSVARGVDRLVFTAYEGGHYDLYAIEQPSALPARTAPAAVLARTDTLPPVPRKEYTEPTAATPVSPRVDTLLFRRIGYRPGLSLDYISQPSVGVAAGTSGLAVGGGVALSWSDMLANDNLITLLSFENAGGKFVNNVAAGVGYTNQRSRLTWGGQLSQIPYLSALFAAPEDDGTVTRYQELRQWEIDRTAELDLTYPFTRFQRVEFSGGFRSITFENELEVQDVSDITGQLVLDSTATLPAPADLSLGTAGIALVFDNSVFGGTSPVLGHSYRLSTTAIAGTLHLNEVLADYRQYVMPVRPFVLAGRILHYGRYGRDAENSELADLFLGFPSLIRGYNDASFSAAEGTVFNRLLGSKLAVGNAELRIPLLGPLAAVPTTGVPPVEAALFYDAGVAWRDTDKASFLGGSRKPVTSMGTALRLNVFGIAVAEIDYVHPNDRPLKGWYWQFALQPGF